MIEFTEEDRDRLRAIAATIEEEASGQASLRAEFLRKLAERPAPIATEKLERTRCTRLQIEKEIGRSLTTSLLKDLEDAEQRVVVVEQKLAEHSAGDAGLRKWLRSDDAVRVADGALRCDGSIALPLPDIRLLLAALADSTEGGD